MGAREEHRQECLCHQPQHLEWPCHRDLLSVLLFTWCRRGKSAAGNRGGTKEFSAGTGPIPVFRFDREFGTHGIPFNVSADALEFSGVSDPMVEGLILPK